jgi:hypothetical protein
MLTRYLPELKDPNIRALYDIIARRFQSHDAFEEESLQRFSRTPHNRSLVEGLLRDAVNGDPQFASELEAALQRVRATPGPTTRTTVQSVSAGRDVRGVIAGGHVAQGKGSVAGEGNVVGSHNRNVKVGGGIILALAIVAVVVFALYSLGSHILQSGQLTASSTCREFLAATQEDQLQAMRKVGVDEHVPDIGSPLALPEISYECGNRPSAKLGDIIGRHAR